MAIYYYLPKARSDITITQTIGCTKNDNIRSVAAATVLNTDVADYGSTIQEIKYKSFDGPLRDADTAVVLLDDGRLSSINATGTGEAAAVLKSAIALAGTFTGVKPLGLVVTPQSQLCIKVRELAGSTKAAPVVAGVAPAGQPTDSQIATVSLSYQTRLEYITNASGEMTVEIKKTDPESIVIGDGTYLPIGPDSGSESIFKSIKGIDGLSMGFSVFIKTVMGGPRQPRYFDENDSHRIIKIKVPTLKLLHLVVSGPAGDMTHTGAFWNDDLVVPTRQTTDVAVTKAQLFGKSQTGMTLAPSGLVTKLEYSKASGAADLVGSAAQISSQAQGKTEAQKASDIQSQADMIYQQQRLINCQLDATKCSK